MPHSAVLAEKTNNFLIPNGTFFFELIVFALILVFLARKVIPRISAMIEKRQETIRQQFEDAKKAKEDAEKARQEYTDALAETRREITRLREEASAERGQILDQARAEVAAYREEQVKVLEERLATERQQILMSLRNEVGQLAFALVRRAARSRGSEPRDVVDALEAVAVDAAMTRAEADDQLDEVEDELFRFERIVDGEPALRAALTNRNLPADRKRDLVHRLLEDKAAPVTVALVERAVLHPRGRTIERVLDEFTGFAAQRRSRLIARVTTAVPLSEEQQDRLAAALAREFGHEVRLQLVVDATIV